MRRSPIRRRGKKTAQWEKIRKELKVRFQNANITTCELRWPQCWRDDGLSFAHSRKRLDPLYDSREAILACGPCHTALEGFTHQGMLSTVQRIIKNRERQP